ncbi:MAG: hypothetical protein BWY95_01608 [Bacteroidetes bacterium ADurb.BinA104]|nr:MAG: hypothetical protein BWY95_01608 [Bacteroidetes bacterium ADurb.BinA104]
MRDGDIGGNAFLTTDEARDFKRISAFIFAAFFDKLAGLVTSSEVEGATSAHHISTNHEVVISGRNPGTISSNEPRVAAHAGVGFVYSNGYAVRIISTLNHTDIEVTTSNSNWGWEGKFHPAVMRRSNFY